MHVVEFHAKQIVSDLYTFVSLMSVQYANSYYTHYTESDTKSFVLIFTFILGNNLIKQM